MPFQILDFREQLFPYLPPERFSAFSCGHIVPPDHVSTLAVAKGPTGLTMEFKFDRRKDEKLVRLLQDLVRSVTDGLTFVARRIGSDHHEHMSSRPERGRCLRTILRFSGPSSSSLAKV